MKTVRLSLIAGGLALSSQLFAASITSVTTFPIPDGSAMNHGAVSDDGVVVFATTNGNSYLRQPNGTIIQLVFPGETKGTSARGVNKEGQIVGGYTTEKGTYGFLREPNGTYVDLAPLGAAEAINNSGTIIGRYQHPAGFEGTFVRDSSGTVQTFLYSSFSWPNGINDSGQILGTFCTYSNCGYSPLPSISAFIRNPDNSTASTLAAANLLNGLTTVPWPPNGIAPYTLYGINSTGDVLAAATIHPPVNVCCTFFILHETGELEGLTIPSPAETQRGLLGMNNVGEVIGYTSSLQAGGTTEGFIGRYALAPTLNRSAVLPHVAGDAGWTTNTLIENPGESATTVAVVFHKGDGLPLVFRLNVTAGGASQELRTSTVNVTIPAHGTLRISVVDENNEIRTGWAEVFSTGSVTGASTFRFAQDLTSRELTVPLQAGAIAITSSFDNRSGNATGIALANASSAAATITCATIDEYGDIIESRALMLASKGHTAFFLRDQFPMTSDQHGTVQCRSTGSLGALGLRFSAPGDFTLETLKPSP